MRLTLRDDLPFVQVTVIYRDAELEISDVLVDTGSATTILAADQVARIGIIPEPSDTLYTIRGVGGIETVFTRRIGRLRIGRVHAIHNWLDDLFELLFQLFGIAGDVVILGPGLPDQSALQFSKTVDPLLSLARRVAGDVAFLQVDPDHVDR